MPCENLKVRLQSREAKIKIAKPISKINKAVVPYSVGKKSEGKIEYEKVILNLSDTL